MRAHLASLRARVILTYLVIFLLSVAIVAGWSGSRLERTAVDSATRELEIQAYVTASVLGHPWVRAAGDPEDLLTSPELDSLVSRFAQGVAGKVTVLDPLGNVQATALPIAPPNQLEQPEVKAALAGAVANDVRLDPGTGQMRIYAAAPMEGPRGVRGIIQVSAPLAEVTARVQVLWISQGITALLAAAVAALVGWWLAGQLVRPVARLRSAAARLATGQLDTRVSPQEAGGITEISELGVAFNHMAERIEDMMQQQRAFVANASHELRTPLTNIKLRAEALGDGALGDPTVAAKFVSEIEKEADRLGRLASDLLTLSTQDARPSPARQPVSLATLIAEVVDEMTLRADKSGVTLAQDVAPALPAVLADPAGLHTVLVNLIDNALQYTPSGGSITIRCLAEDHHVIVRVSDTGDGIPTEDLPYVFDRFYRADKSRRHRTAAISSGAGLGLSIVKGVVEEHGGTVSAASELGRGTTITFTLPYQQLAGAAGSGQGNQ